jgi:hypothetical protein
MDSHAIETIKHVSNTEVVRRLLIKYFVDKGFTESFDRHVYPAILQDLIMNIPQLSTKVEVVPFAEEVDSYQGKAVLGWNLFVLGTQRMYLGQTYHNDLRGLARQIQTGFIMIPEGAISNARRQSTPRRIVTFVTRVLESHNAGYVDLTMSLNPRKIGEPYAAKNSLMSMPQQYFSRSGYGT